jgi:hypothetical protein
MFAKRGCAHRRQIRTTAAGTKEINKDRNFTRETQRLRAVLLKHRTE